MAIKYLEWAVWLRQTTILVQPQGNVGAMLLFRNKQYVTAYAKVARKNSEKKGKSKICLVNMPIPKCKNTFSSDLKLHLMSLKLTVFQYNSCIQTSKIYKNHFFPSVKRPTFQNVMTHKIFEIL
jgi:hypothetical protein